MLQKDPNNRIGVKSKKELKDHPFFEGIDWLKMARKEYDPPFVEKDEENLDEIPIPKRVKWYFNVKNIFRNSQFSEILTMKKTKSKLINSKISALQERRKI